MDDDLLYAGSPGEPYYPSGDEPEETDGIGRLPSLYDFADLCYVETASLRLGRDGSPVRIIEFKCMHCRRAVLCSIAEAVPPPGKPVPLCGDCLEEGRRCVLVQREYSSGPLSLNG